ncbi:preprotein translocase subunit YajC [Mycetocola lacteus]|uniref:Preprotein translocase subunit YajC n=2 Tax=Mycetocola lacteus TaxID=76637 RepID=A0A3L7AT31_9MICO|nr:preprotein translocase subunit YajC [Mycetocola lacteus]
MDFMTVIMLAVMALLIFFMFRNGQKRKRDLAALQEQVVPGAEVMTNGGIFGTIISIDDENNKVLLETSPGTILTVHRQIVSRVVPTEEPAAEDETAEAQLNEDNATFVGEPEFGERAETAKPKTDEK